MVCPSLRLLRNEQQSNSCRLMICTLGAETGIKVVRGRQGGRGGLWSNWVSATAGRV